MNNMNKKRDRVIVLIILLIMIIGLLSGNHYNMTNPTKLNKIIANNLGTPANNAFTDQTFYNCVIDAYNEIAGEKVSYTTNLTNTQLEGIKILRCRNNSMTSTSGLELMTNLTLLELNSDNLTSLDVSKNVNLTELYLGYESIVGSTQLTSLDISKNVNLTSLSVSKNQLTNLDVSKNVNLEYLDVSENQLKNIDVNNNPNLLSLKLGRNNITSLDISNNPKLSYLDVGYNKLTSLDVSNNENLSYLDVGGDSFNESNSLTNIDVSKNVNLKSLDVSENQLTNLNVSKNVNLKNLNVSNNNLTSIDVSNNSNLEDLDISRNNLKNIDINNNVKITYLDAQLNNLTNIDVSKNVNLKNLLLYGNSLTNIDVSKNVNLTNLNVTRNELKNIDVSNNSNLVDLSIRRNQLSSLDISKNEKLTSLSVEENNLTSLDVSNNPNLTTLHSYSNPFDLGESIVYKNDKIDLSKKIDSDNYKLNSNFTKEYNYSYLDDEKVENLEITCSESGEYNYKLYFKGDSSSNLVSGLYKVYVTELTSDKYIVNNDEESIFVGSESDEKIILSNLGTTYGTLEINDNKVQIKNGNVLIKEFQILRLTTNKYVINDEEEYIFVGSDYDKEEILSNLNIEYGAIEISDNKLQIKNGNEVVKEFKILNISSDKYKLESKYIYTNIEELDLKSINTECELNIKDNNLEISYNGKTLDTYKIVRIISNEYKVTKEYIYLTEELDESKITVINGGINEKEDTLEIIYNDEKIDSLEKLEISFGDLHVVNNKIIIKEEIDYKEFIGNISSEKLAYDVYYNENKVTDSIVKSGMTLKVTSDKYGEIENYEITTEYINISNLNINENNIILGFKINDTYEEILKKIETTGEITVTDNKGEELTKEDIVRTGSKIKIEINTEVKEYTVSVIGDVTGTGKVTIADVMKTANYILDNSVIEEECYKIAADVTEDGNIKISDVMQLANYILKGSF